MGWNKKVKHYHWLCSGFITFTDQRFETIRVIEVFSSIWVQWVCHPESFSGPQPWKRFFFFEHLIRPHLSRPKTSIQQSIPSPGEGLRSGFWKRQSHRMAPGTGPGTSSDTHISYYAVRAFLFSTHYLVNVDTAGVYQKMPLYVASWNKQFIKLYKIWAILTVCLINAHDFIGITN